jgi:putative lipoprotein
MLEEAGVEPTSKRTRTQRLATLVVAVAALLVAAAIFSRGCTPSDDVSNSAPPPPAPGDVTTDRSAPLAAQATPTIQGASAPPGAPDAPDAEAAPRLMMYDCGNVTFATRTVPGEAMLFAPELSGNESVTLKQTEATSGERYAAGDTVFWNKGNVATFELRGQVFVDCAASASRSLQAQAQARGVLVWATGNQPSWSLEITPQQLTLTTEPGARRNEFPYRAPTEPGTGSRYPRIVGTYRSIVGTEEIVAVVGDDACNDSLSGEVFPVTVAVTFEQRTLYGCGQIFPLNMPRGR